jgi:3-hydroxyacyl-[acyl-carrier-protein] dehydratase
MPGFPTDENLRFVNAGVPGIRHRGIFAIMRWFWIDRFEEFLSGKHAVAVKCITMSDEPVDDYSPGRPFYPASLIVEGLAQCGGLLVGQLSDFRKRVVLAKVTRSKFYFEAEPGDVLVFRTDIVSLQDSGGIATGTVHVKDRLLCEADLTFAYLDDRFQGVQLFLPAMFCRTLRSLKLFDVGRTPEGGPVSVPDYMLAAEEAETAIV